MNDKRDPLMDSGNYPADLQLKLMREHHNEMKNAIVRLERAVERRFDDHDRLALERNENTCDRIERLEVAQRETASTVQSIVQQQAENTAMLIAKDHEIELGCIERDEKLAQVVRREIANVRRTPTDPKAPAVVTQLASAVAKQADVEVKRVEADAARASATKEKWMTAAKITAVAGAVIPGLIAFAAKVMEWLHPTTK